MLKLAVFHPYLAIFPNRYNIGLIDIVSLPVELLWKANKKS